MRLREPQRCDAPRDLELVVPVCIDKDPNRRYARAGALAADLQRVLHRQPILARPPSTLHRVRTFVGRHRIGVLAGAAVTLALLAGIVAATWGLLAAQDEAADARSEAARSKMLLGLLDGMLTSAGPEKTQGKDYSVRQMLDDFDRYMAHQVVGQPEFEATLRQLVGQTYSQAQIVREGPIELRGSLGDLATTLRRAPSRSRKQPPRPGAGPRLPGQVHGPPSGDRILSTELCSEVAKHHVKMWATSGTQPTSSSCCRGCARGTPRISGIAAPSSHRRRGRARRSDPRTARPTSPCQT